MEALEKNALVISAILGKLLEIGINSELLDDTEFVSEKEHLPFVQPCMEWLANEGLVVWKNTAHSSSSASWLGPTLTSRGIAIMGARLEVEGKSVTVAEYVSNPPNSSGNLAAIGEFLGSALGGFAKTISS